jgi:serine/threonine protein kinase
MELVEGEDLSQRIARRPIPLDEALPIAKQIAEALEAAHEQGVIHRDLKPANVRCDPTAPSKCWTSGSPETTPQNGGVLSMSPTITSPALVSGIGVLLGTAAYMSPEQAKGLPADHRSEIFSFGCVLYEMLTGRQLFQGDSAPDILAAVIVRDADRSALPADLNTRLVDLSRRCLDKNPRRRWQGGWRRARRAAVVSGLTQNQMRYLGTRMLCDVAACPFADDQASIARAATDSSTSGHGPSKKRS